MVIQSVRTRFSVAPSRFPFQLPSPVPVPDNQEVFIDDASDASLILELLDLERDKEGLE
ncbi:hypothetical protein NGA_0649900, partial [Nannochloropsis gaditana CCMP526]|uniref:uncharacterized protein n=1 Tax=Nannochloropsis gaditana (strain CCMP526) TaxID=1093141 RepID=UPI00029F6A66